MGGMLDDLMLRIGARFGAVADKDARVRAAGRATAQGRVLIARVMGPVVATKNGTARRR